MPDTPDMEDLARRYMDLWQEHLNGHRNWQHQLWCVLMLAAWRRQTT